MSESVVLRTIGGMLFPYILVYGLYVQMHGEIGPGGGFQAGVLVAAAFILHALLFGKELTDRLLPTWLVDLAMSLGVLLTSASAFSVSSKDVTSSTTVCSTQPTPPMPKPSA